MAALFETTPVDFDVVRRVAREHWGLELGELLKASQNHTFAAFTASEDGKHRRAIVRATPDPRGVRGPSIDFEARFLRYLASNALAVCAPFCSSRLPAGCAAVREGSLVVCAFPWAKGEPIDFARWLWMTERRHVVALGAWIGRLHALSRRFAREHSADELVGVVREWSDMHSGVLHGVEIAAEDQAARNDPELYGILHGDVNPSNYHWDDDDDSGGGPCVFDWDQVQRGWFLYDLAQPIFSVVMLATTGSPLEPGKAVPEANPEQYTQWIVEGYESADERGRKVDRTALARMVALRREFYRLFCTRAVQELDPDSFMGKFCRFVADTLK